MQLPEPVPPPAASAPMSEFAVEKEIMNICNTKFVDSELLFGDLIPLARYSVCRFKNQSHNRYLVSEMAG